MSWSVTNSPDVGSSDNEMREASVVCDLCGIHLYQATFYGKTTLNPVIQNEYGNAACVQVTLTAGERGWDWGAGETTRFDLCPKCFEEKLAPWLELHGAMPKRKGWSY